MTTTEPSTSAPPSRRFRVAGVSFADHYPENLQRLAPMAAQATTAGVPLPAILRRNPANRYDANAIEVHVPALAGSKFSAMVGHLPAVASAHLAPVMDRGERLGCEVVGVAIDPDHADRPGLEVRVWVVPS